ncbi:hypothetical protein [Demequina litorisediminis]|uniref:HTH dtxR-type domain-containing protein n=1 Tax=Demequina litorisediminis TaxID=1849022 RepID=A0ABQ6ICM1_9MICO|nr:hypothetical protein [Demequina litorisediminis]GMA35449.1 hypothetical protein GCM10025876_16530 [Demequina litorisediminis]
MADANVTEDYLKAIYNATEWSDAAVTVTVLANRLSLSPSSVSELVRKAHPTRPRHPRAVRVRGTHR